MQDVQLLMNTLVYDGRLEEVGYMRYLFERYTEYCILLSRSQRAID